MKKLYFLFCVLLPFCCLAQKPFSIALKVNPYTNLTGRYGANLEIPLAQDWSVTLEGRYLTKDWNTPGGGFVRQLAPAKGYNAIAGLRYYFVTNPKNRWFVSGEYRYRKASYDSLGLDRKHQEFNFMSGIQFLPLKNKLSFDIGLGLGKNFENTLNTLGTSTDRSYLNVRIDFLLGYRF